MFSRYTEILLEVQLAEARREIERLRAQLVSNADELARLRRIEAADCEGPDCIAVEIFAANPPIEPGFKR